MRQTTIPDAIEPIVAWRYWRAGGDRDARLRSLTGVGQEWPPDRPLEADCRFARHDPTDRRFQLVYGFTCEPHASPDEACTCGIYGARDLKRLRGQMLFGLGHMVAGEVSLWGKVIPGAYGYRAEYAYPKHLYVIERAPGMNRRLVDALKMYGVPVETIPYHHASFNPAFLVETAVSRLGAGLARLAQRP